MLNMSNNQFHNIMHIDMKNKHIINNNKHIKCEKTTHL